MNKRRLLVLTLTLAITFPTAVFAKGNEDAHGKNSNAVNPKQQEQKQEMKSQANQAVKVESKNVSPSTTNQVNQKIEAKEKKDTKAQEIATFKSEMKAKHDEMKQIRQQTIVLKQQIEQKENQLSSIILDLQAGKKTLPEDEINSLITLSDTLQVDSNKVEETSEISSEVSEVQAKVKGQDFNNALISMDKVIGKMQARLDALNKLNTDLDVAIKIANTATTG
ncbi:putative RND superfamily exporter protein [Clostridium acetobutylicum]|uniref:Uncharacterized protein n=1 Tax=Clostridium acetobutylicum (strain ATCC 824 / DSM 792 / JCM 1419 / IAM 19013 / LMG 5710 / NBRC 13948 / NRRL B-527 / VKM B-1787 / 2291 / W) TaxID=272562 RepID=Q97HZ4_CLOAB|nr:MULTISPECIES: hypothetical protein [Clostridium]AAK79826.1 Hypothetical protein CA_C1862 [Clostridium acetobutylicum ATCC 824]ADZ20912.1 Conserved hypothetical protein [Clostridium acetobutylicum EA 2018]AEI32006.1 hypothetical protein SMB_G1887 [Clostridium acetobutylicum DSM 1731]AWV79743.1 hypothetical protein DK921_06450 [Clostridium acetobutylicum]MBC2394278.1 hypothetical protein [Clostridium acetobutylicum]